MDSYSCGIVLDEEMVSMLMRKITGVKAISFDGDGTLWDFDKSMRNALSMVLKELEEIDPEAAGMLDIDKMIAIRDRVAGEMQPGITDPLAIRLNAFRQTLIDTGRPSITLAAHLNRVYLRHRQKNPYVFNDALPTLDILKEKYKIGLLSNGNTYPGQCGLDNAFSFIVLSQDYGVKKPDAEIFRIALEKSGCSKDEMLHVGDSLEEDVIGASKAGIKCIWLNRSQAKRESDIRIDYEIGCLSEIFQIL